MTGPHTLPRKNIPLRDAPTNLLKWSGTHTVCEESRCPNREECSRAGLATFLIGGPVCTRRCSYCNIATGKPQFGPKQEAIEVRTIRDAVEAMGYRYVVITAVNRDDKPDGGSGHFLNLARALGELAQPPKMEFLIPDFRFRETSYQHIIAAAPTVVAHNLETVRSIFKSERPQGNYDGSLKLLEWFKAQGVKTKTALILGLGEGFDEIAGFLQDSKNAGVDIITIGQFLSPSTQHREVSKVYSSEEWQAIEELAAPFGFEHTEIGPFVRSSYMAHRAVGM